MYPTYTMPKRSSDTVASSSASSSAGSPMRESPSRSPKKPRTPPKKDKASQVLTFGIPCYIRYHRVCDHGKLWKVVQAEDKSDCFMKNVTDTIRNEPDDELRKDFDFRGDVTRRVSLSSDEPMKNHRKSYERKFLYQVDEEDTKEKDLRTAKAIFAVSTLC